MIRNPRRAAYTMAAAKDEFWGGVRMSDLGKLFRLRGAPNFEPLENFTTAALAIAIGHDDRPIILALNQVDSTCQGSDVHPALAVFKAGDKARLSVVAETQKVLWPADGVGLGYLDLVLTVRRADDADLVIWVEVKVDAWESGNQLTNYREHAERLSSLPAIITLARTKIKDCIPFLKWSDIVDCIAEVPDAHHAWVSLLDFLWDERIVWPPAPTEPVEAGPVIDVIIDVNRRISRLWPKTALVWPDGRLRHSLEGSFEAHRDLVTSGGPLRYGLMPAGKGWEWGLVVTTKNYQNVDLDAQLILRDAEIGGLPLDWVRDVDRFEVLERRASPGNLGSHDEIVAWFDEGLQQLREAKILERFFDGLATKQASSPVRALLAEEGNEGERPEPRS